VSNGLLDGKVAVVTGASNGIGRAIAIAFAVQGASAVVVLADLDPEPRDGGPVTSEVIKAETPANPVVVTCDVSRAGDVDNAVAVAENLGGLDVMVNNAGIAPDVPPWHRAPVRAVTCGRPRLPVARYATDCRALRPRTWSR